MGWLVLYLLIGIWYGMYVVWDDYMAGMPWWEALVSLALYAAFWPLSVIYRVWMWRR